MFRTLDLACPNAYKAAYPDVPDCFFEADGAGGWWLKIFCKPGELAPSNDYLNQEGYAVTFRRVRRNSSVELIQRGYKITLVESRAAMFHLVKELSTAFRPITVRDFVTVEAADFKAARNQATPTSPFTLRRGLISRCEPAGPMAGTSGSELWVAGGFSFEFKEEAVRGSVA